MLASRYDRQQRVKFWNQEALSAATIMVAGAGALGNEIIKNLALAGIGKILIIDFDEIELSNLNRTVLFRDKDIGKPKASTAAEAIKDLNPDIVVKSIHGDLFFDIGLGFYRHTNLVISGLDNIAARAVVGRASYLTGVPFIDGGTWSYGGELKFFVPKKSFCYDCTLNEFDWQAANVRRSCTGFKIEASTQETPRPANILPTAIIGALVAQEAVKWLMGRPTLMSGEAIVFNGLTLNLNISQLPGLDNCYCKIGQPYDEVEALNFSAAEVSVSDIISYFEKELGQDTRINLGRDLLTGYKCNNCGLSETFEKPILQSKINTPETDLVCPNCDNQRLPITISYIEKNSELSTKKLIELGIPRGEILLVTSKKGSKYFELSQDIIEFWD